MPTLNKKEKSLLNEALNNIEIAFRNNLVKVKFNKPENILANKDNITNDTLSYLNYQLGYNLPDGGFYVSEKSVKSGDIISKDIFTRLDGFVFNISNDGKKTLPKEQILQSITKITELFKTLDVINNSEKENLDQKFESAIVKHLNSNSPSIAQAVSNQREKLSPIDSSSDKHEVIQTASFQNN